MSSPDPTLVAGLPLVAGMSPTELRALCAAGTQRAFAAGQALFHQGDSADQLICILSGRVRVWRCSEDGTVITLHLLAAGAVPGAVALFRRIPYPATATGLEAGQLIAWPAENVTEIIRQNPVLGVNALALMGAKNEALLHRVQDLSTAPVEVRVARALVQLADGAGTKGPHQAIDLPVRRQDVAEIASTTLHSVSRLISRWERDGYVLGGRGRILVLDLPAIEALARPAA